MNAIEKEQVLSNQRWSVLQMMLKIKAEYNRKC